MPRALTGVGGPRNANEGGARVSQDQQVHALGSKDDALPPHAAKDDPPMGGWGQGVQHEGVTTDPPVDYHVWSDRSCFGLGVFKTRDAAEAAMARIVAIGWEAHDLQILVEPMTGRRSAGRHLPMTQPNAR